MEARDSAVVGFGRPVSNARTTGRYLSWRVATVFGAALVVAYIIEEIVWMMRGRGRPCVHCGQNIPMKSFRVHRICPACGKEL